LNVLVTGITGFIGSILATKLVEQGDDVYGLVRHSSERELKRIEKIVPKIHLIEGDLVRFHSVLSAVETSDPNVVFHLGALTPVRLSFDDPYPYIGINFDGTVNLVHSIVKQSPNTRLIAASTAEVYGWQPADRAIPINSYGRVWERGFYTEYLISKMLMGETCYIGAPDSIRDYMFAEDHVDAYLDVARSEKAIGEVYNVSPGNPVTNVELAKKLSGLTGFKGKLVLGTYPPGYPQRPQSQDPAYLVLDNTRISREVGWHPRYSLDEGLKQAVELWSRKIN